ILILWIIYAFSGPEKQQAFAESFRKDEFTTWQMGIASIGPISLVSIYMVLSTWTVFRHTAAFKDVFTNLENLKVGYIREFILIMLVEIFILGVIAVFTPTLYVDLVWVPIFGNLLYFYIIYKSYNYGVIFSE